MCSTDSTTGGTCSSSSAPSPSTPVDVSGFELPTAKLKPLLVPELDAVFPKLKPENAGFDAAAAPLPEVFSVFKSPIPNVRPVFGKGFGSSVGFGASANDQCKF